MFTGFSAAAYHQEKPPSEQVFGLMSQRLETILAFLPEGFPKPTASNFFCFRYGEVEKTDQSMAQDYVLATGYTATQGLQSIIMVRHHQQERVWGLSRCFHMTHQPIATDFHDDVYKPDAVFGKLQEYLSTFYQSYFTLRPMGYFGERAALRETLQKLYGGPEKILTPLIPLTRRQSREFRL